MRICIVSNMYHKALRQICGPFISNPSLTELLFLCITGSFRYGGCFHSTTVQQCHH